MAANRPMNKPVSSSAASSLAAETHLLDLTSVCVTSGTVRLPLSLQGHFAEGDVLALADGVELKLRFQEPRTLAGLADFFARNDLKANDRVRFEFAEGQLSLGAVKRERRRSVAKADVTQTAAAGAAVLHVGESTAPVTDPEASRDRSQPAAELGAERARGEAEANHASVRAVKRVRIEGGTPPRQDLPAPQPIDRASSRDVWARRQHPAWRPLDTTDGNPTSASHEDDSVYSETTVRAIRRSRHDNHAGGLQQEASVGQSETETPRAAAPSYAPDWPLVSRGRAVDRPRQAAPTAELDPYLDAPLDVDLEAEQARHLTGREADVLSPAADAGTHHRARSPHLQASDAQQGRRRAIEPQEVAVVASARGGAQRDLLGGLFGRLGLTRSARPRRSEDHQERDDNVGAGFSYEETSLRNDSPTPTVYTDQSVWPLDVEVNADDIASSLLADPDFPPSTTAIPDRVEPTSAGGSDATAGAAVATQPGQVASSPQDGKRVDTLSGDMELLEQYLAQPETAAIVRCEDLAHHLSIDYERVARALKRMAEDRDRYTPLRGDAYMVRRAR